ncbi:Fic family protein [Gillisia sp. Q332]|uniref:Fic family protein n=1 Tax=Gillisia xinjiangensis TaxID=3384765 RepID=UPI00391CCA2E
MKYNWQQKDWPNFSYSTEDIEAQLYEFSERAGKINGLMEGLPEDSRVETVINLLVEEAIKTSEIEGEYLSRKDVISSIKKNLGLLPPVERVNDKRAEGIAELMTDAQKSYKEPLSAEKILAWHKMLMKGNLYVQAGKWRTHTEPMQVISGAMGKEIVHYEAPPSSKVPKEMEEFISWFNRTGKNGKNEIKKPVIRAAIAHLYFETIHPFEDGNGRIGRAVAEKALSQTVKRPILLSLSQAIEKKKNDYYTALKLAQRSNEISPWINYFVRTTLEAQIAAEKLIEFSLYKTRFFDRFRNELNDRQMKVIRRVLKEGPEGFEGGINAKKYIGITKTSKATATRDLQDLQEKKIISKKGQGRSTAYILNLQ